MQEQQDLYDLFRDVKKCPMAYLGGRRSIYDLQSFYLGYVVARHRAEIPVTQQEKEFLGFEVWLQEKFHLTSSKPWAHLIYFRSDDEYHALSRFFELLEQFIEYQQQHNVSSLQESE